MTSHHAYQIVKSGHWNDNKFIKVRNYLHSIQPIIQTILAEQTHPEFTWKDERKTTKIQLFHDHVKTIIGTMKIIVPYSNHPNQICKYDYRVDYGNVQYIKRGNKLQIVDPYDNDMNYTIILDERHKIEQVIIHNQEEKRHDISSALKVIEAQILLTNKGY